MLYRSPGERPFAPAAVVSMASAPAPSQNVDEPGTSAGTVAGAIIAAIASVIGIACIGVIFVRWRARHARAPLSRHADPLDILARTTGCDSRFASEFSDPWGGFGKLAAPDPTLQRIVQRTATRATLTGGSVVARPATLMEPDQRSRITTALSNWADEDPPRTFAGRYLLSREQVHGGQAVVNMARDARDSMRQFAIKVFCDEGAYEEELQVRTPDPVSTLFPVRTRF